MVRFKDMLEGFETVLFMFVILFGFVIVPLMMFGSFFETRYTPVYDKPMVYSHFNPKYNQGYYVVTLDKVRECDIIDGGVQWHVESRQDKNRRIDLELINIQEDKGLTLVFNVKYGEYELEVGQRKKLTIVNECHSIWLTKTEISIP